MPVILVFIVTIFISTGVVLFYGISQTSLDLKFLIVPYFAVGGYIMATLFNAIFNPFGELEKEQLAHSKKLVEEVFKKTITNGKIVYDKDRIHITNMKWAETSPMFAHAIQHLNHKKHKKTWQAYIDSKKYSELLINKIISKIEKYRETVKHNLCDESFQLISNENEPTAEGGKWVYHIIYHEVIENYKNGASNKQLMLLSDRRKFNNDYYLTWWTKCPEGGFVKRLDIAKGDESLMENLKNIIEQLISDRNIIHAILDIDFLITRLKDDSNVKIFEGGRKKIVNQVLNENKVLEEKCSIMNIISARV